MNKKHEHFANEEMQSKPSSLVFANVAAIDDQGWVQLAPYGDFGNVDSRGNRVIQRFQKPDAEAIVNEFNSLLSLPTRLLGLPWYIGHPDHPRFRMAHTDTKSYGRVKKVEARDDGFYGNVKFGSAGRQLVDDEAFSGHSVNWKCVPIGRENGHQIFKPVSLKSVGFTNDPAIPVRPASLANEETEEEEISNMIIPPKLKLIAGFKEDEDVTMEQIIAALMKAHPMANEKDMDQKKPVELTIGDEKFSVVFANEESAKLPERITKLGADKTKAETDLANEKKARTDERKAIAALIVAGLVTAGKIVEADRDAKIQELANAGDFEAKAKEFADAKQVVKTAAKSNGLAGKHTQLSADMADRSGKFQQLVNQRAVQYPGESYDTRWAAVAGTDEGKQLLAQMKRPGDGKDE